MHSVWLLFQCSLLKALLLHFFYVYLTREIFSAVTQRKFRNRILRHNDDFPLAVTRP